MSDEAKKHLSDFWMGKKKPASQCINMGLAKKGEKHPLFGVSPSAETLAKRSASLKGKKAWNKGLKCPQLVTNWQGGISTINHIIRHSMELRLWRESVFTRDDWTCRECSSRGGVLNAHHIKPFSEFPELRFAIDNGVTLCYKCHRNAHRKVKTNE